jgi:hypothetical protein
MVYRVRNKGNLGKKMLIFIMLLEARKLGGNANFVI